MNLPLPCSEMVDIHAHILPGIDDGPQTLEESLALAQCYVGIGIRRIICTSHFIPGTAWAATSEQMLEKMAVTQEYLRSHDVDLTLYPGMEVAFHRKLRGRLEAGKILPLAGSSRYLLEPAFSDSMEELLVMTETLVADGFRFILAHPERIPAAQVTIESIVAFALENDLQIQLNIGSLLGRYGRESQRAGMEFISRGCVQYLASDAHGAASRRPPDAHDWQELANMVGADLLTRCCCTNPAALIAGA